MQWCFTQKSGLSVRLQIHLNSPKSALNCQACNDLQHLQDLTQNWYKEPSLLKFLLSNILLGLNPWVHKITFIFSEFTNEHTHIQSVSSINNYPSLTLPIISSNRCFLLPSGCLLTITQMSGTHKGNRQIHCFLSTSS